MMSQVDAAIANELYPGWELMPKLTELFEPAGYHDAVAKLKEYFHGGKFAGAAFNKFCEAENAESPNRLTASDVLALSLLSDPVATNAVMKLVNQDVWEKYLLELGADREFVSVPSAQIMNGTWLGYKIETLLREIPGVGETTATKLLARKRPNLVPIVDSKVRLAVGNPRSYWRGLYQWLTMNNGANVELLERMRADANLQNESVIRIFDVLAWLVGSGKFSINSAE